MRVEWKDAEHIVNFVSDSNLGQFSHLHNLIARTVGDCLRCYNLIGKHDESLYEFIIAMKRNLSNVRWLSSKAHGRKVKYEQLKAV